MDTEGKVMKIQESNQDSSRMGVNQENEFKPFDKDDIINNGSEPFVVNNQSGNMTFTINITNENFVSILKNDSFNLNELLKLPQTLPYCKQILEFSAKDKIKCKDAEYRILDIANSKCDSKHIKSKDNLILKDFKPCNNLNMSSVLCRLEKILKGEKYVTTSVTEVELLKLDSEAKIRDEKTLELFVTVFDVRHIPRIMIYFVLEAIVSMLEHLDLFVPSSRKSDQFSGVILVPSNYATNRAYISGIKEYVLDTLNEAIESKRKLVFSPQNKNNCDALIKQTISDLLDIGMSPSSVDVFEEYLNRDTCDLVTIENIKTCAARSDQIIPYQLPGNSIFFFSR